MTKYESQEIELFHKKMNDENNLPHMAFRRNVHQYALVCYVNNIIGCYLSENFDAIPIFIQRSRGHIEKYPSNGELDNYYNLVDAYLFAVESFLKTKGIKLNEL